MYLDSYRRLLGQELIVRTSQAEDAHTLFHAPFIAVSHGTELDPVFNYGNAQALSLWEFSWAEFTRLPSRFSAEEDARDERDQLLKQVRTCGFATGYSGVRATRGGRRFRIVDVTVWNLIDEQGRARGQGATYQRFEFLS
jgi:hypothetical protein